MKWPTSATGAGGKGNEGVASYVNRMKNSIGYVEYAYAKQNNMAHTALKMQRVTLYSLRQKPLPQRVISIGHNTQDFIKSLPTLRLSKHGRLPQQLLS